MIVAVVLAAGSASRMGRPKALLPWKDTTLLGHAVAAARAGGCAATIVVLGAAADEIRPALDDPESVRFNPDWASGMAGSIGVGVQAARERGASAVLVLSCDQPLLSAELVGRMVAAFDAAPGRIVACRYADTIGIPALFEASCFDELRSLRGDRGARQLLQRHSEAVVGVDWPDGAVDVDTAGDYRRLTEG